MGVVTTKSKLVTNRDSKVISNSNYAKANLQEAVGYCAVANGDSTGSKLILAQVPSNARISDVLLTCADIGTTTAGDVGLYRTTDDGGAVVDADFFKAAQSFKDGALADAQVAFGNVITHALAEKMIWELLNLSADPNLVYDVVITLTGDADAAGGILAKIRYAQ